jgi:hypothetical protein
LCPGRKDRAMAASWLFVKWPHRAPSTSRDGARSFRWRRAIQRHSNATFKRWPRGAERLAAAAGILGEPLLSRTYRWVRAKTHSTSRTRRAHDPHRSIARASSGLYRNRSGFPRRRIPRLYRRWTRVRLTGDPMARVLRPWLFSSGSVLISLACEPRRLVQRSRGLGAQLAQIKAADTDLSRYRRRGVSCGSWWRRSNAKKAWRSAGQRLLRDLDRSGSPTDRRTIDDDA